MARFTRSSASENPPSSSPKSSPVPNKKRKRPNTPSTQADEHPEPAGKLQRTVSPPLPSVGDVPIKSEQSLKILDILQTIDTQGLLDRVFPLSDSESLYSLRNLLENSPSHPLSTLRSAVQHLFPISYHPLSRPSQPAAKQQAFCNLTLSLLDQASSYSVEFPGDLETLIPDPDDDQLASSAFHRHQTARYALVQHLPSGDYWTSLNSEASSSELKDLAIGHSELVSILPSPYPSTSTSEIPSLGSYHKPLPPTKSKAPVARKVGSGSFLDYGLWASFAPSFDQESAEIGRQELGQILYARQAKKNQRDKQLQRWTEEEKAKESVPMIADEAEQIKTVVDVEAELEELFPPDQLEAIKSGLGTLELELAVSELLERNQKALRRLQDLQSERLFAGSSRPEEGSEEWDTAQAILDSLTILASLRPRSSSHENSPFIPPVAVLHALHRTLPLGPSPGWYGNLPVGRTTVLRDDNTIKVKPGVPVAAIASTPTPTPAPAASTTPVVASNTGYGSYSYSPYPSTSAAQQTPYRPGTVGATPYMYKPAAASGPSAYYPTQYSANSSAGAQAYGGTWYSSYTPQATTPSTVAPTPTTVPQANGSGSGSGTGGRGTPVTPQPSTFPPTYSSFFSNSSSLAAAAAAAINGTTGTPGRTPAVANTVMKPGQWNNTASSSASPMMAHASQTLTLPLHLRPRHAQNQSQSPAQSTNGILPGQMGQLGQQSNFYGYQTGQYPTATTSSTPAK